MSNNNYPLLPDKQPTQRKPDNWSKHRHEVRLQIMLPLVIAVIIFLILAVLVGVGSYAQVSQWADVATIWLAGPMLIVSLLFLVMLGGLVYGLARLLVLLPGFMARAQDFFKQLNQGLTGVMDKLVEPFLRFEGKKASWGALTNKIRRK